MKTHPFYIELSQFSDYFQWKMLSKCNICKCVNFNLLANLMACCDSFGMVQFNKDFKLNPTENRYPCLRLLPFGNSHQSPLMIDDLCTCLMLTNEPTLRQTDTHKNTYKLIKCVSYEQNSWCNIRTNIDPYFQCEW